MSETPSDKTTEAPPALRGVLDIVLYVTARLLLLAIVAGAIYGVARLIGVPDFPPVLAAMGGLIISMPLGMWMFGPLRRRATATISVAGERRRQERDQLRARLRGEPADEQDGQDGQKD